MATEKQPSTESTQIKPQGVIEKRRWTRRKKLIAGLVIIAVVAIVGGLIIWWNTDSKQKAGVATMTDSELLSYEYAEGIVANTNAAGADPTSRALSYSSAGKAMGDARQYDKSLSYYLEAQKIVERSELDKTINISFYREIAEIYAKTGSKSKAREYYDKAIAAMKSHSDNSNYNEVMKQLQDARGKV